MVDLTFTNETKKKTYTSKFFLNIVSKAVNEFKFHKDIGLSVNLIGKVKMQTLNKKHRKKDKATDVLSFPLSTKVDAQESHSATIELGDIFICPEVAQEKAKESGKSMKYEMSWLIVHGLLHLLGYDHERSPSEEKKMFSLQDKILKKL